MILINPTRFNEQSNVLTNLPNKMENSRIVFRANSARVSHSKENGSEPRLWIIVGYYKLVKVKMVASIRGVK